jgi:transmembrane sensor
MEKETQTVTSIPEQAACWWEVLHDEDVSAADHRDFAHWVTRGPERVAAYLRVAQLQGALHDNRLRWPASSPEQLIREARESPEDVVPLQPETEASVASRRRPRMPLARPRIAFGLAAAVLVALGLGWLTLAGPQRFHTSFGEQRSFLLGDGSRVTLNSASKIEVRLGNNRRSLRLLEGEALFEVAHDPARPFEVLAGNAVLRAIGTQFDVDGRPDRTIVTVVEGRVALVSVNGQPQETASNRTTLVAADRIVISDTGALASEHGIDVSAALSWIHHQLIFKQRPLGEVADEFNRYNRDRIEIRGAALRAQEITGTFQSNDSASFIAFLASIPGVRITVDGRGNHSVALETRVEPRP